MRLTRRIAAYGVCHDGSGRVLLVRLSDRALEPGRWLPPGGGIEHGEHPADAVVREIGEETGLLVEVTGLRGVLADVVTAGDVAVHNDRVVYDVVVRGGELRDELDNTTDRAAWCTREELSRLPLVPFAAETLSDDTLHLVGESVTRPIPSPPAATAPAGDRVPAGTGDVPVRGQRFAAYGLVTDPAGRVLLALIADGYPGGGRWHLPGGGTDHGEQPEAAFLRELAEETGQAGRITGLLDVTHHRNRAARGPEGYVIDWHAVRALYRAEVDVPTAATVTEAAGGSTARAGWFAPEETERLLLSDIAAYALRWLPSRRTMG